MSETDVELLARYSRRNAEEAFAEIVRRHLNLVYSAALRQVRSPQLAEEVAQSAFLKLAHHARELPPETIITAWLYQVTRREAIDVVRRDARRQLREQVAYEMNAINATDDEWAHVAPLLDEAMHALDETDRAAVLLRYFENKNLREVGAVFGLSDDAAQKRVSRAVERLREFFTTRGITVGASGLAIVLSAHAVQAAPIGLALTVSTAVLSAGTTALFNTATLVTMKLFKTKVAVLIVVALMIGGSAGFLWELRTRAKAGSGGLTAQALTTNEMLYREMVNAYLLASELAEGHPDRVFWQDRKSALLQAGYIETRVIPMAKPVTGQDAPRIFFDSARARFGHLEWSVRGFNGPTPPIATVTARKIDFGPSGAVEQFIRNYDAENSRP